MNRRVLPYMRPPCEMPELVAAIDRYLRRTDMRATLFGWRAVGDCDLVNKLRHDSLRLGSARLAKVLAFMRDNPPPLELTRPMHGHWRVKRHHRYVEPRRSVGSFSLSREPL